ncbi:MAG: CoA transferase [Acidimicrobiales bacterium]
MDEALRPWTAVAGAPELLGALEVLGEGPALPSVYPVTDLAAGAIGAATLAAAALWSERGGPAPAARIERTEAAVAFRSERCLRVQGAPPAEVWGPLSGDFRTAEGAWVRIHANFAHHRDAALAALGLAGDVDRAAVREATAHREGVELVEAIMSRGGAAASWRSTEAWADHPQGRAVRDLPLVSLTRLDASAPAPLGDADRPLGGVRVLDLSRVLAGPVCGRFLAAHGADVLRVSAPHLPTFDQLDLDTGFGKRSCHLDLRDPADAAALGRLVDGADVFVQAYRPGSLAARGFGPAELAARRPGIVVVELSAYGRAGPWAPRRGFDSLVQMASGIVANETAAAGAAEPRSLPAQALDHGTGYLAALGAIAGLSRRIQEGGSWLVEVSLARTGRWLDMLGRVRDGQATPEPDPAPYLAATGPLTHLRPPGLIPASPPRWERPPPAPGEHPPAWW